MNPNQLFDEIRQIIDQYKKEVPSTRRSWPASIRERITRLRQLEVSKREISNRTGIPESTVYIMLRGKPYPRRAKGAFLPVKVRTEGTAVITGRNDDGADQQTTQEVSRFTATLPGGIRVEGMTIEALAALSRGLA